MNPNEESEQRAVEIEYELPQSPDKVWRVLSESKLVADWLLPNTLQAEVGHRFSFQPSANDTIDCEVLEVEPGQRLSYSWRSRKTDSGEPALDTIVTFDLIETAEGGTLLRLVHSGFPQRVLLPTNVVALPRRKTPKTTAMLGVKLQWAA